MQPSHCRPFKRKGFSTPFAQRPAAGSGTAIAAGGTGAAGAVGGAAGPAEEIAAPLSRRVVRRPLVARAGLHAAGKENAAPAAAGANGTAEGCGGDPVYEVMYAVNSTKKHKKWNTGTMVCTASRVLLHDEDDMGKEIAGCYKKVKEWEEGEELTVGKYLVEVVKKVEGPRGAEPAIADPPPKRIKKSFTAPLQDNAPKRPVPTAAAAVPPSPDCLVLQEAPLAYLDRALSVELRQHQRDGVRHLFQTTNKPVGFAGAILADEMGLGKTLQCVSLIQAHLQSKCSKVRKVLIVVPSSLVKNWAREFSKWLKHSYRSQPTILTPGEKKDYTMSKIRCFRVSRMMPVMILSYEMCRNLSEEMKTVPCDLLLCDEGHRLKGLGTQILKVLQTFPTPRKVLITGTPVQNNLAEYYALFEFINPGLLGDRSAFNRAYLHPIAKMNDPDAAPHVVEAGAAAQASLTALTAPYMLRRTHGNIDTGLPPKTEVVLFFKPSPLQEALYEGVLSHIGGALDALQAITLLKKVLTSPALISAEAATTAETEGAGAGAVCRQLLPLLRGRATTAGGGGKMELVLRLLEQFRSQGHKCVVVSSSVKALECIEGEISARGFGSIRFDGSVSGGKRMELVDTFNSATSGVGVMLLSCKAGGVGLNLIGASRLILADMDWNPANDLQAIARIWREGQTKACRIYRLVCRGTLEERVLQRQLVKMNLSHATLAMAELRALPKKPPSQWSHEEVKRLFEYDSAQPCLTFTDTRTVDEQLAAVAAEDPALLGSGVTFLKCLAGSDGAEPGSAEPGTGPVSDDEAGSESDDESIPDPDCLPPAEPAPVDGDPPAAPENDLVFDDENWFV